MGTLKTVDKGTIDQDFRSVFGSIKKVVEAAGDDGSDIVGGQNNSNEWKQDVGERSRRIVYESLEDCNE